MGIGKNGYFTLADIKKFKCKWNIIIGERAPGKSFAVKEEGLTMAYETGKPVFGYIRRNLTEIQTAADITAYFEERGINLIEKVTHGEYTFIDYYRKYMWFARYNEEGKIERGTKCGEAFALRTANNVKSTGHPYLRRFIFEEFITDGEYLDKEPDKLQHLISTLVRNDDEDVRIYMVGNTINRVCPYISHWGLVNILKQQPGTIDKYEQVQEDGSIVEIAVEYSPPSPNAPKNLFFGSVAKSIKGGGWQTGVHPLLPEPRENYERLYVLTWITTNDFMFNISLLAHKKEGYTVVYIYRAKHIKERVVSQKFNTSFSWTSTLDRTNPAEVCIHNLMFDNKFCFRDNLTGEDFKNSLKQEKSPF